jgi:ribosomal protein S18 acetylase RimI-like enzyme
MASLAGSLPLPSPVNTSPLSRRTSRSSSNVSNTSNTLHPHSSPTPTSTTYNAGVCAHTSATHANADSNLTISFRPLCPGDFTEIKALHDALFPLKYSDYFFQESCAGHGMGGRPLYSALAVCDWDGDDCDEATDATHCGSNTINNGNYSSSSSSSSGAGAGVRTDSDSDNDTNNDGYNNNNNNRSYDASVDGVRGSNGKRQRIIGFVLAQFVDIDSVDEKYLIGSHPTGPPSTHTHTRTPTNTTSNVCTELCYILTIGVRPQYAKLGLASKLLEGCVEYGRRSRSCGAIYLHVIHYNMPAINFYEKNQFEFFKEIEGRSWLSAYYTYVC